MLLPNTLPLTCSERVSKTLSYIVIYIEGEEDTEKVKQKQCNWVYLLTTTITISVSLVAVL